MLKNILTFCLLSVLSASAHAVIIANALDWRQPLDTVINGLTYDAISADPNNGCDVTTGVCTGTLNGVGLDGWNWATKDIFIGLVTNVIDSHGNFFIDGYHEGPFDSWWGDALVNNSLTIPGDSSDAGLFFATSVDKAIRKVYGSQHQQRIANHLRP